MKVPAKGEQEKGTAEKGTKTESVQVRTGFPKAGSSTTFRMAEDPDHPGGVRDHTSTKKGAEEIETDEKREGREKAKECFGQGFFFSSDRGWE